MLKLNRDERSLIYAQLEENLDLYALRRTCKVFHRDIPPISPGRAIVLEECAQRSHSWLEWFRSSLPRKARLELVTELLDSLPFTLEKAALRKVFRVFAQDLNFNQSDCRDLVTILWRNACYASLPHWKIEYATIFEILLESTSRPWVFNDFHLGKSLLIISKSARG